MISNQSIKSVDNTENLVHRLRAALDQVAMIAGKNFSGLGVIVCNEINKLPLFPLRQSQPEFRDSSLQGQLAEISSLDGSFHDGFHLVDENLKLKNAALYFSPPIRDDVVIDYNKRFGGRYLAALFGSMLPSVIVTAVVSRSYGVVVFRKGREA